MARPLDACGQALVETLVSIPLLLLFAAGALQFGLMFASYVDFEHACGEAARRYAAGSVEKSSLGPVILENLGPFSGFFDPTSLQTVSGPAPVLPTAARNEVDRQLDSLRSQAAGLSLPHLFPSFLYETASWDIRIRFQPGLLFARLFKDGVLFHTTMEVYRYKP
jgi:TadE-like protein